MLTLWEKYDRNMLRGFDPQSFEGPVDTKPSRRINNLGKAFQNYRRTILNHLEIWKMRKVWLWRWRRVCTNFKGPVTFAMQVWTDDNMEEFVKKVASFQAQIRSRNLTRQARKDPRHKHHDKELPMLIPAHMCKLWQICLVQAHGEFYQRHFGDMSVHRLAQTPLVVLAEGRGLDTTGDNLQISQVQALLFDVNWLGFLDKLTATSDVQEQIMHKLEQYGGESFWKYTLDTTERLCPVLQGHSGVRSHLSRNVFEQISARLFLESLEQGPFEQGAGSASDGTTVVQRVDDAPAVTPAEESAPSRPPKPRPASQPPAPSRPAPALAVARPEPEPEPASIRWRNRQATQPVLSVVAPAARPSSTPSPANAIAVTRAIRTAAQTSGDIRDNFDIKSGNPELDAAVARVSRLPPPAEPVPFTRKVFEYVQTRKVFTRWVADSATNVANEIQQHITWRLGTVVEPFLRYCAQATASERPLEIGTFGSTHYGLALPTSDIDVVIITAAGRNGVQMLERVKEHAAALAKQAGPEGCFSQVKATIPPQTQTLQLKYRSVWVDVRSLAISRASDKPVASTDLLKYMLEQRSNRPALAQSILVFKLVMHHLEVIQWHTSARGQKFKAISISFFALAVLDQMPELGPSVVGSAIGLNLLVLIKSFAEFDFRRHQVNISKDGSTSILPKTMSAEVVVYVGAQESNSTFNVRHDHVDACQKKCKTLCRRNCHRCWRMP